MTAITLKQPRCSSWLGFFCFFAFPDSVAFFTKLRLAMADFGVTSALVSIVLSVFMAGLGLGAWGSGYLIRRYGEQLMTFGIEPVCIHRVANWRFGHPCAIPVGLGQKFAGAGRGLFLLGLLVIMHLETRILFSLDWLLISA